VRLYLVDASIYIFQAHVSPYINAQSVTGDDRSAFVGFARFLLRLLTYLQRSYRDQSSAPMIAVAFDHSLFSGFRHQLYPHYKSNRELPDANLELQLEACFDFCLAHGVNAFGSRVYEADDIIGTLADRAKGICPVTVISRDKDLAQVLSDGSSFLWDFMSGREKADRQQIFERMGFWPEQLPCFLGLTGDAVDCIPGVRGIGPVAARSLITRFGDLDSIYANLEQVTQLNLRGASRIAMLLREQEADARLSKALATIRVCDSEEEAFAVTNIAELSPLAPQPELLERVFMKTGIAESVQSSLRALDEAGRL